MSNVYVLAINLVKRSFQVCATERGGACVDTPRFLREVSSNGSLQAGTSIGRVSVRRDGHHGADCNWPGAWNGAKPMGLHMLLARNSEGRCEDLDPATKNIDLFEVQTDDVPDCVGQFLAAALEQADNLPEIGATTIPNSAKSPRRALVVPSFLTGLFRRIQAAIFNFWAGVFHCCKSIAIRRYSHRLL